MYTIFDIVKAINANDETELKKIFKLKPSLFSNLSIPIFSSPLLYALATAKYDIYRYLLNTGENIESLAVEGNNILHLLVMLGDDKLLLEATLNAIDRHLKTKSNATNVANLVLAKNKQDLSPLEMSFKLCCLGVSQQLEKYLKKQKIAISTSLTSDLEAVRAQNIVEYIKLQRNKDAKTDLKKFCQFYDFQNIPFFKTLINFASFIGNLEMVNHLAFQNKKTINVLTEDGNSPLHLAILRGHIDIVKTLNTHHHLNFLQKNDNGDCALLLAILMQRIEIIRVLMPKYQIKDDISLWGYAAENGGIEHLGALWRMNIALPVSSSLHPMLVSVKRGSRDQISYFLDIKIPKNTIDELGNNAVHLAVLRQDPALLNFLAKNGFDLNHYNNDGQTPLLVALNNGYSFISNRLIHLGANVDLKEVNGPQRTPLMWAVTNPNLIGVADEILKKTKTINERTPAKISALHYSLYHTKMAKLVLAYEPDVNVQNSFDITPLAQIIPFKNAQLCFYLIEAGASLTIKDYNGNTPPQLAAIHGFIEFFKILGKEKILKLGFIVEELIILAHKENQTELIGFLNNWLEVPLVFSSSEEILSTNFPEIIDNENLSSYKFLDDIEIAKDSEQTKPQANQLKTPKIWPIIPSINPSCWTNK